MPIKTAYRFELKNDRGKSTLVVTTISGLSEAISKVVNNELCPLSAIISIRKLKGTRIK